MSAVYVLAACLAVAPFAVLGLALVHRRWWRVPREPAVPDLFADADALAEHGLHVGGLAFLPLDPTRRPLDRGLARRFNLGAKPAALACMVLGMKEGQVDIECMGQRLRVAPCRLKEVEA